MKNQKSPQTIYDPQIILTQFKTYLKAKNLSHLSIKNYLSDLRRFLTHLQQHSKITSIHQLQARHLDYHLQHLKKQGRSPASLHRTIATFKHFGTFLEQVYHFPNPFQNLDYLGKTSPPHSTDNYIKHFTKYLKQEQLSSTTIKSYKSDASRYLNWLQDQPFSTQSKKLITKSLIKKYLNYLTQSQNIKDSTLTRKTKSLTRFHTWFSTAYPQTTKSDSNKLGHKPHVPTSHMGIRNFKDLHKTNYQLPPKDPQRQTLGPTILSKYLPNILLLTFIALFFTALGVFGYRQFAKQAILSKAYPSSPIAPNRQLSFQGRLVDSAGTPITTATDMVFKLYDAETNGTELYSTGTCSIVPDQDGVFSTQIGSDCGSAIPSSVFTENSDVWLEVTVGSETLTPRQQIATVAYALNAETIQGIPLAATMAAIRNTIVPMNQWGEVILGEQSPTLKSIAGTFQIQGAALTFSTATGTNGNIIFSPDGTGQIKLLSNTQTTDSLYIQNAQLTSGSLLKGYVGNDTATGNLLTLSSGSTETNKFTVDTSGNTYIAGNVGIGTTTPSMKLDVAGSATVSGTLSLAPTLQVDAGACDASSEGKEYYDADNNEYYYCDGSTWKPLAQGSSSVGGSGSTNYLAKWASSTDLGNSVIYDDGTNVGIGTTSPSGTLEVNGTIVIPNQVGYIRAKDSSGSSLDLFQLNSVDNFILGYDVSTNNSVRISPGQGAKLVVTGSGNVGIGTTSPAYKLDVSGDASVSANLMTGGQLQLGRFDTNPTAIGEGSLVYNTTDQKVYYYDGSAWTEVGSGSGSTLWTDGGTTTYLTSTTDNLAIGGTDSTAPFYFDASTGYMHAQRYEDAASSSYYLDPAATDTSLTVAGKVGVGTTTPTEKLEVSGNIKLDNLITNTGLFTSNIIDGSSATAFDLQTANSLSNPTAKLLSVKNGSNELMYLDALGNLYVSGSVTAGKGFTVAMVNNSGGSVETKSLVVIDTSTNSSFTTTTIPYSKKAFGVVQGVEANSDTDGDGVCDSGETCLVAVGGEVDVLMKDASSVSVGDYVYTSDTAKYAVASAKQYDGLVGVVSSTADASSGYVKIIFKAQPQVSGSPLYAKEDTITSGDYLELVHNANTSNIMAQGWVYDSIESKWKDISSLNWKVGNNAFNYRRSINIDNTSNSSSLTDYQVLVTFDTATPIAAGKMQSDCDDIRFTDNNNTELGYWIESGCNTSSTKIWVKVPSIPANGNATIYLYYGNSSVSSASNGDNVFEFFDDFESGTEAKWNDPDNGWSVVNTTSYQGNYSYYGYDGNSSGTPSIYPQINGSNISLSSAHLTLWTRFGENNLYHYPFYPLASQTGSHIYAVVAKSDGYWGYHDGTSYQNFPVATTYSANTWYKIDVSFSTALGKYWVWINNNLVTPSGLDIKDSGGNLINSGTLTFQSLPGDYSGTGQNNWYDNYFIRQYTTTEPNTSINNDELDKPFQLIQQSNSTVRLYNYSNSSQQLKLVVIPAGGGGNTSLNNGLFTNSNLSVPNGSYVEVKHNQNTNDFTTTSWIWDSTESKWQKIDVKEGVTTTSFNVGGNLYSYRRSINIDNTSNSSSLTDYQVLVTFDTATPIAAGKMQSDCDDIRFTDNNNTELGYWIESGCNTSSTKIWVKVPSIPANGNATIYLYYGNSSVSSASNGDNVFEFFDDFIGSVGATPNTSKWTVEKRGSTSATVELDGSGDLHLAGEPNVISSGNLLSINTFTNNFIIELRKEYNNEKYNDLSIGNGTLQDSDNGSTSDWWHTTQGNAYMFKTQDLSTRSIAKSPAGASTSNISSTTTTYGALNTWETDKLIYDENGQLIWNLNGTNILTATDTSYLSDAKHILISQGEYSDGNGGDQYVDWIRVRKYTPTEPSTSVNATEENGRDQNLLYQVVQTDSNTVRLYNYSGSTQGLRLDVITGGIGQNEGSVSLHPYSADTDTREAGNSIWINKTSSDGNLLRLQASGTDIFNISSTGIGYLNGSLGIGTTAPAYKFDVYGTGDTVAHWGDNVGDDFMIDIAGGQGLVDLVAGAKVSGNDYIYTGSRGASRIRLHDGSLTLYTSTLTTGTAGNIISWNTGLHINNAGNVGIGTTSPIAKLHVQGAVTGKALAIFNETGDQALLTASASGVTKFIVDHSGNIGIGTTSPSGKLDVQIGSITNFRTYAYGSSIDVNSTGGWARSYRLLNQNNNTGVMFGGYNGGAYISAGVDTSTDSIGYQNIDLFINTSGNVGIGTTTPTSKLHVQGAVTGKALAIFNETGDQDILVASASGVTKFRIDHSGYANAQRFVDLASTSYYLDPAATDTSLNVAGTIRAPYLYPALGSGDPYRYIRFGDSSTYWAGFMWNYNSTGYGNGDDFVIYTYDNRDIFLDAGTGTVSVGASGGGKLDAGTIDPPYTIAGKKYATYLPGMTGVKEETTGTVYASEYVPGEGYRYTIDFTNLTPDSDLWLFSEVTHLSQQLENLVVLLSPAGNTRAWYQLDAIHNKLHIYSSAPTYISYRLTAPRFDADKWANTRDASNSSGFIINNPNHWQDNPNGTIIGQLTHTAKEIFTNLEAKLLSTNLITPEASSSPIIISNNSDQLSVISDQEITNDQPLLVVDGTITTATISARLAKLKEIQTDKIKANTIEADIIKANHIEGLDAKIATLSAQTVINQYYYATASASPAGTPLAEGEIWGNLSDQELQHITQTIKDRLANLLNPATAQDIPVPTGTPPSGSGVPEASNSSALNTALESTPSATAINPDNLPDTITIQPTLSADIATINNYLAVIGQATITNLDITNRLYTSTITSKTDTLEIQPLGGTVKLAANTLVINSTTGTVEINGNLKVNGTLYAQKAQINQLLIGSEPISEASPSGTSNLGKLLAVYNEQGQEVASIDASGSANFNDLTTQIITIASSSEASSSATPSGILQNQIASNATAGQATLVSPNTELTITSPYLDANTLVYITPTSNTFGQVLYVKSKHTCPTKNTANGERRTEHPEGTPSAEGGIWGCSPSFTVAIDSPVSTNITFNWWIIKLQNQKPH